MPEHPEAFRAALQLGDPSLLDITVSARSRTFAT
jgi:hypothetical protein